MDGMISMYVLLVCVWCSLDAGGLLMVVTAQPEVFADILTPESDRKEGGQVDMRCTATNLLSDQIVEWRTEDPMVSLRWNDTTIAADRRFMFTTTYPQRGEVVQDLTITDLQSDDYDEYICDVKDPLDEGGHLIVAIYSVILSAPSYPICSPSGPTTVDTGTELRMRCLSETDNPAMITGTHPMTDLSSYPWTSSSVDDMNTLSLNLTITVADDGVAFNCSVVQGHTVTRSCIIGPINVTMPTDSLTTAHTVLSTDTPLPASNSAVIAGAVGGGVAALLIIILLILICRKRRLCHQTQKDLAPKPSTNTDFTPGHPEKSPSSFFDRSGVDIHDQSQDSHLQYSVTEAPVPKPTSSPTKSSSSEPVVYALPNTRPGTISTHSNAGGRDVTSHNNPAYDSMDLDGSTEQKVPVKPVAMVRPSKKPRKPEPYQLKSERQSNPPDITNQDLTPQSSLTDQDESHPSSHDITYAQVSRPKKQQSRHDNPDHIVYADLDLQSDENQDGGPSPQSSSDAVTYASVNMY